MQEGKTWKKTTEERKVRIEGLKKRIEEMGRNGFLPRRVMLPPPTPTHTATATTIAPQPPIPCPMMPRPVHNGGPLPFSPGAFFPLTPQMTHGVPPGPHQVGNGHVQQPLAREEMARRLQALSLRGMVQNGAQSHHAVPMREDEEEDHVSSTSRRAEDAGPHD